MPLFVFLGFTSELISPQDGVNRKNRNVKFFSFPKIPLTGDVRSDIIIEFSEMTPL